MMTGICKAAVYLLASLPVAAQSQAFAKIVIKPASSADSRSMRMQILPGGDLKAKAVSVVDLLTYAYDVPANPSPRLNALPGWPYRARYDIEASLPAASTAPSEESEAQSPAKQRLRQLLADRFKLVMRLENRRMPAYALTVAGSGPKLQRSSVSTKDCIFDTAPEGCHNFILGFGHPLNANAISMDDLAHYIENWTDLPVVDRTHLIGLFTMHTKGWQPMQLPPPPPNGNGNVDFSSLPTLVTVLGKLGLELHRQEDIVPIYTVEHIERQSGN